MTATPLAPAGAAATTHFLRVPTEFANYVIGTVAASRILGVEPGQVDGLASGTLPHADGADLGPLYDYSDLINLALFSNTGGQGLPGLAMRFMLRFASAGPDIWFSPTQWLVRVRAPESAASRPDPGQDQAGIYPVDPDAPGVEPLTGGWLTRAGLAKGTVEPPGYQVAVRITGAAGTVEDATANRLYDEMLSALLSGTVIYQSVTEKLRMRHEQAWALGTADCCVLSRVLAGRLREAGLAARARRGYLLGLVGSDHSWCELLDGGRWKPMDVAFEYLASGSGGTRSIQAADGFAAACRGGRFSRLLACQVPEASATIHLGGEPAPTWWTCAISANTWES